jgi:hypothetical protein
MRGCGRTGSRLGMFQQVTICPMTAMDPSSGRLELILIIPNFVPSGVGTRSLPALASGDASIRRGSR